MKIYLRVLAYARPLARFVIPYLLYSIPASLFSILNLALLKPLLDILFNEAALHATPRPEAFSFSIGYFTGLFNYHMTSLALSSGKLAALQYVCVAVVVSVLLSNVFRYLSVRTVNKMKGLTITRLRQAVYHKMMHLDLAFFTNERKGNLMTRLTTDVLEIENSLGRAFSALLKEVFLLVGYFVVLFYMSVELTLFSIIIIPLSGAIIGLLSKRLKATATSVQQSMGRMIGQLDESLGGMRVVKGFNAENYMEQRFQEENNHYYRIWRNMVYRQDMASPLSEFLGVAVVAGILLYGGSLVLSGRSVLEASAFVTYIALFSQVTQPAKEISNALSSLQRGRASAERLFEILDMAPTVAERPLAQVAGHFRHKIDYQDVSFSYETGRPVLQHVSFSIEKGQTVALVGPSGGGKSTLADLLPRFYDPTAGRILLDGTDLRDLTQASLRSLMGIVTQESILFNDTIYNNIAFGMEVSQAQVEEAARIANAHEFIVRSPDGYQTVIGDRGSRLSGGQRQRLSIARAILKNPPILILDEATSALDTESERLVQEALTRLMAHRTTLVVAHRLSTIQHADLILVIEQGRIVEQGRHEALLQAEGGLYRKLNQWQTA